MCWDFSFSPGFDNNWWNEFVYLCFNLVCIFLGHGPTGISDGSSFELVFQLQTHLYNLATLSGTWKWSKDFFAVQKQSFQFYYLCSHTFRGLCQIRLWDFLSRCLPCGKVPFLLPTSHFTKCESVVGQAWNLLPYHFSLRDLARKVLSRCFRSLKLFWGVGLLGKPPFVACVAA